MIEAYLSGYEYCFGVVIRIMYESIDISELRKLYSLYSDNIQALADVIQVLRIRKENETISRTKQLKKWLIF